MPDIITIGAGAAGLSAALELAERGYSVTLIEQATLGSGSSGRNPGRMGHGFHYLDINTAKMYLRASIQVQRKYPSYLIGKELERSHPIRRGRYFITKNSDHSVEQILNTYKHIKDEYIRLIEEDPNNAVFGPPEDFFRILNPIEYEGQVNPAIVELGVETAEHLFDWQSFAKDIKKTILAHKNITLLENAEVVGIERGDMNQPRFLLHVKKKSEHTTTNLTFQTNYLVNSTWHNIEKLNDQIGITMVQGARTNRLKCLLIVKLPESLITANSMFFCMGQHCMFSNLGNGYGMMTFAHVTNMEASTDLTLSDYANRLLNDELSVTERASISQSILAGVASYIPGMAKATIIDLKFGIVQTAGALTLIDLKNPLSPVHKRDYDGIREEQVGLVSNPCVKLFYFVRNGQVVADIIDAEVNATSFITKCMVDIEKSAQQACMHLNIDVKKSLLAQMERHISSTQLTPITQDLIKKTMIQSMLSKQLMLAELSYKINLTAFALDKGPISIRFLIQMLHSNSIKLMTLLLLILKPTDLVTPPLLEDTPLSIPINKKMRVETGMSIFAGRFFANKRKALSDASENWSKTPT